jgi:RND family efflux transporter MFP subunit
MKWLRKFLPLIIVAAAVVVMLLLSQMRTAPPQRPVAQRITAVEAVTVAEAPAAFEVRGQGTVQPRTQTSLVSEVSGNVLEVAANFAPGGFFKRGDLMLKVDPRDYDVAVLRAEAALAGRRAQLEQEVARSEQAAKDWASLRRGGQPNPLVLRKPYLAEAEANVRSAEADLAAARIAQQRTQIRAPFDGLLREKRADIGQYVNVGTALGVLAATDVAEVRLPLTEADLAVIDIDAAGDERPVRLQARGGGAQHAWEGTLARTEGVFDERSRVMHAVVQVDNPYAQAAPLKFGTFVEARLPASIGQQVISVPRRALRGMDQLLLVDAEDRLRLRTVDVLRADQHQIYVGSGLAPGERVVTTVIEAPVEGMQVRVVDGSGSAVAAAPSAPSALEAVDAGTADVVEAAAIQGSEPQ